MFVFILNDEYHVETRQYRRHKVYIFLPFYLVPTAKDRVRRGQYGATSVQRRRYSSFRYGDGLLLHGLVYRHFVVLLHFVELIYTNDPAVRKNHRATFHHKISLQEQSRPFTCCCKGKVTFRGRNDNLRSPDPSTRMLSNQPRSCPFRTCKRLWERPSPRTLTIVI